MKKTYRSLIAIILAVTMIFAANSTIENELFALKLLM